MLSAYFSSVNDVYTADELQRIVRRGINVVIEDTHEILLLLLSSSQSSSLLLSWFFSLYFFFAV